MPIHDYKCEHCGHIEERFFRMKDKIPQQFRCKSCSGISRKTISSPAISIFQPRFEPGLGKTVESQKELDRELKKIGAQPSC